MSQKPATRVLRGWLAASVCTWSAFAAHAHSAPTSISIVAMLLITCVSAAIGVVLVGKRYSFWATSALVLLSQGLYHLSLSSMSHSSIAQSGHAHHLDVQVNSVHSESMLYAHVLAAIVSIAVLYGAERLLKALGGCLSLSSARRILTVRIIPSTPTVAAYFPLRFQLKLAQLNRLPERRGPPSFLFA